MAVYRVPMVMLMCSQMAFFEGGDFSFSWEHKAGAI